MGLIKIENMEFYAYHGHFKEEQIVGNRFLVDLTIETDMQVPAKSDDLNDALNYQVAYNLVKHIAGRILDSLYNNFNTIKLATVKVSKMNPPMGGKMERVSVTLSR